MSGNEFEEFKAKAERIAEEISAMSEEERRPYIVENNLEHLVSQERIDDILKSI